MEPADSPRSSLAFAWSCALALLALLFAGETQSLHADPDLWHEMSLAREALREGAVPWEDHFAYTPTVTPCVHHEWGTGLLLLGIVRSCGERGLLGAMALLVVCLAVASGRAAIRSGVSWPVLVVLAPLAVFLSWIGISLIRAQMFTLLLLAILMNVLAADRAGHRRWVFAWALVHLAWLNLHAGFVVGMGLLGLHAIEQAARGRPCRHLLGLLAAESALVLLNPWGWHYYAYLARALGMSRPAIGEWAPVWQAFPGIVLQFSLSLCVAAYALWRLGLRSAPGWPLVVVSAVAAALHQRHLSIWALVWVTHVPAWIERTPLGTTLRELAMRRARAVTWGLGVLALGLVVVMAGRPLDRVELPANAGDHPRLLYPVGAVGYLAQSGFQGNLFLPFTAGGYASWCLYPRVRVSIDGRYEVAYPPGWLSEVHDLFDARPGWKDRIEELGTDAVLVPEAEPLARALAEADGWSGVYRDDAWRLFVRDPSALQRLDRRGSPIPRRFPD